MHIEELRILIQRSQLLQLQEASKEDAEDHVSYEESCLLSFQLCSLNVTVA